VEHKGETGVEKDDFKAGRALLGQPALPLVSIVQFLYLTGDFATVAEVIDEMPEPIETGYALYEHPRELLRRHLPHLELLESLKNGEIVQEQIIDETGEVLDTMTAVTALVGQRIMEDELEPINSALCSPCGCTLCCTGPDQDMEQEFFEIPLQDMETDLFSLARHDDTDSRSCRAMDDPPLLQDGKPFYMRPTPELFHWQNGWSMILPKKSSCPGLAEDGRCRVYIDRPRVCRKPQIFSYILEPTDRENQYRLRSSLLAVTDCPYVQVLQDKISAYAAACELEIIFKGNKQ
jgi:Fe-S-cluster containining protein